MEDVKSLEISTSNRKILILDIELCIFQNILESPLFFQLLLQLHFQKEIFFLARQKFKKGPFLDSATG